MAKVKGPLMSMDGRGQLGKSLVFLGWKGLKTVRSYVVPANPNSTAQQAQRGVMTAAVAAWHAKAYNDLDARAFNVLASIQSMVMSGFNAFCKIFIQQTALAAAILQPYAMALTLTTPEQIALSVSCPGTVACKVRYGSSLSVMGSSISLTKALTGDPYTGTITGLTSGEYVYFQIYTEVASTFVLTGIYKVLVA